MSKSYKADNQHDAFYSALLKQIEYILFRLTVRCDFELTNIGYWIQQTNIKIYKIDKTGVLS